MKRRKMIRRTTFWCALLLSAWGWFGGVFLTLSAVFAFAAVATISASAGLLLILAACAAVAVGVRMNSGPIAATAEMALATYATLIGVLRAMRGQTVVTWAPAKSR